MPPFLRLSMSASISSTSKSTHSLPLPPSPHPLSKYKLMENSLSRTKLNMKSKKPEIEKTLELVRILQEKQMEGESLSTHYNLGRYLFPPSLPLSLPPFSPPSFPMCLSFSPPYFPPSRLPSIGVFLFLHPPCLLPALLSSLGLALHASIMRTFDCSPVQSKTHEGDSKHGKQPPSHPPSLLPCS